MTYSQTAKYVSKKYGHIDQVWDTDYYTIFFVGREEVKFTRYFSDGILHYEQI